MRSPLGGFCQAICEVTGRGPGPAGLLVDGGGKYVLIFLAFALRPGFDEQDQLSHRHTVSQLQPMGRQFVTRGLPLLAGPGRKEIQFVIRQLHCVGCSQVKQLQSAVGVGGRRMVRHCLSEPRVSRCRVPCTPSARFRQRATSAKAESGSRSL